MFIPYLRQDLDHLLLKRKVDYWQSKNIISKEQIALIDEKHPVRFYQPHFIIKVGLFLFTLICCSAAAGFFYLFTAELDGGSVGWGVRLFIVGIVGYFVLETMIHDRKLYHSGIDNALHYYSAGHIMVGLALILNVMELPEFWSVTLCCLIAFPVLITGVVRYIDWLSMLLLHVLVITEVITLLLQLGNVAQYALPFAGMLLGILLYVANVQWSRSSKMRYYKNCFQIGQVVSLILLYLSGNYFVIREARADFFGAVVEPGKDVPLAVFFYLFTVFVPLLLVYLGILYKDRIKFRSGLLFFVAGVLTIKYYYSFSGPEVTLTAAGIANILIAWATIHLLKKPVKGYHMEEETEDRLSEEAKSWVMSQTIISSSPDAGTRFGGGEFGGGGADGKF